MTHSVLQIVLIATNIVVSFPPAFGPLFHISPHPAVILSYSLTLRTSQQPRALLSRDNYYVLLSFNRLPQSPSLDAPLTNSCQASSLYKSPAKVFCSSVPKEHMPRVTIVTQLPFCGTPCETRWLFPTYNLGH